MGSVVMCINLVFTQLRKTQTAVLHLNEDGSHTILVNLNKSLEEQRLGVLHELSHIKYNDFNSVSHVNVIEHITHDRDLSNSDIDEEIFYHVVNSKDV